MILRSLLLTAMLFFVLVNSLFADVPTVVNYQGLLTDTAGVPIDTTSNVTFRIYDAPTIGTLIWTETQSVTAIDGIFTVLLGAVTPIDATIIDGVNRYLEVQLGASPFTPRTRLVASPYAIRIATVDGASGGLISGDLSVTGKAKIGPSNSNSGSNSFVAGESNSASGDFSAIGSGKSDSAKGTYSGVFSGYSNLAGDNSADSGAFVGGGIDNSALATNSSVVGGSGNIASGLYANIGGGTSNGAGGEASSVSGGYGNVANGYTSSIAGGYGNRALLNFSFAAGFYARANHAGSFVLAANSSGLPSDSNSTTGAGQMLLRATGNFYLTNTGGPAVIPGGSFLHTSTGGFLGTGGAWTNSSDKNKKENFSSIDDQELLEKISELYISEWNYKSEGEKIKHIGPVSQDFYEKFGLGYNDKTISTIDASGVALAAIKALYSENKELKARLEKLESLINKK